MPESYYVLKITFVNKAPETLNIAAQRTVLGRESGDIVLADPQCSGSHAEILFNAGQVTVRDLGSTNGTYLGGQRLPQFNLSPGQTFSIGQTTVQLMAIQSPQAQPVGGGRTIMAPGGAPAPQPGGGFQPVAAPPPAAAPVPQPQQPAAVPAAYPQQPAAAPAAYPQQPAAAAPVAYPQQPVAMPVAAPQQPAAYPQQAQPQYAQGGGGPPAAGPGMGMPVPAMGGAPAPAGVVAGVRPNFTGTGGELFGVLFVGMLLTMITFGIYYPWFICKMNNYVLSKTTLGPTQRGQLQLAFTGRGGELFVLALVGYLLTMITFGIYGAWFLAKLLRFFFGNSVATAQDGTRYQLRFDATGGELFVTVLVGYLLTMITFGIYGPWFLCKLQKLIMSRTAVLENGQQAGALDFVGRGGELFVTVLVGGLLTAITLYIYLAWFQVKLFKFYATNTRVQIHGRTLAGDFTGTGGEYFVINLVGGLLTMITFGIYVFWFMAKLLRFQVNNTVFRDVAAAAPAVAQFAPQQPVVQ